MRVVQTLSLLCLVASMSFCPSTVLSKCIPFDPGSASAAPAQILIVPDGSGPSLESQGATIHVLINECPGVPSEGIPAADIWLEPAGIGATAFCEGSGIADGPTDVNGTTTFTGALAGGGWSTEGIQVYVGENAFWVPLPISVVSPDINGDLSVDLADIGDFAEDFVSGYAARSDFNFDGRLDLNDIGTMAIHVGASCP